MRLKQVSVLLCLALATGIAMAADTAPCERPLKHLSCTDLKSLEKTKGCKLDEVEKVQCPDPIVCAEPEKCPPADPVFIPVPFAVETIKEVPAAPTCAAENFIKQWNIQVAAGQNNFLGLQGRYKSFGLRMGQYDVSDAPVFGTQVVTEAAVQSSRNDGDHKITICHKQKVTITIDQSAWPAHQAHGDTVGACTNTEPPPTCGCDDGVCREECPQNCEQPPVCGDGVCAEGEQCPEDCNTPPSCNDGVCRESCPQNCNDGPKSKKIASDVKIGHAYTIEGLYFIPLPDKCSQFSLYVGAGVTRRTETSLIEDLETGRIFQSDTNNKYRPSGTLGAEYRFKFPFVVGGAYSTASGFMATAGYSYRFK